MAQIRDDHYEAAVKHIQYAHEQQASDGEYDHSVRDNALIAQAEATLALVKQMHAANLINAYDRDALIHPDINHAAPGSDEWHVQRLDRQRFAQQLAQQITDVLGMGA